MHIIRKKWAYYNEIDPKAAAWIRELIKAGLITDGEVDERSIEDVLPNDVIGFARCHWFAGIAVWDHALNRAGYDRWDTTVWTGSCPCQPFSAAGKRGGTSDERHLWPAFYHLISQCRPDVVFGEQVASPDGLDWLDLVYSDMEAAGYTVGALDLCAAGLGAPHIRQRLYFVADAASGGHKSVAGQFGVSASQVRDYAIPESRAMRVPCDVGNAHVAGQQGRQLSGVHRIGSGGSERAVGQAGATNGFWRDAEWIYCRDGKYRAVESVSESMADGLAGDLGLVRLQSYPDRENAERTIYAPLIAKGKKRVMRLRGYGNAICAPVAEAFIRSYLDALYLQTSL